MAGNVLSIKKDGFTLDVSPFGGAVLSAFWHGIPILAPTSSPGLATQVFGAEACFPLVPFGNRIEDNRFHFKGCDYRLEPNTADPLVLHGDGWLQRWSILKHEPHRIDLGYHHRPNAPSPFAYQAIQSIEIGDDDSLTLSLSVTNEALETLPYGLGFHPYFPRTPQTRLFARTQSYWTERENHLPGKAGPLPSDLDLAADAVLPDRFLNNAFDGWDGTARIEWPDRRLRLMIACAGLDRFVLYSPSAHDGFFCFEPMSHRPNGHNGEGGAGLVALPKGAGITVRMTLSCLLFA